MNFFSNLFSKKQKNQIQQDIKAGEKEGYSDIESTSNFYDDDKFYELLKKATAIKKEKGFDEASLFLINSYKKYPLSGNQIDSLIKKLVPYFTKCQNLTKEEITNFLDYACDNPVLLNWDKYNVLTYSGDYFFRIKDYSTALRYYAGSFSTLNPFDPGYYFNLYQAYWNKSKSLFELAKKNPENYKDFILNRSEAYICRFIWEFTGSLSNKNLTTYNHLIKNFYDDFKDEKIETAFQSLNAENKIQETLDFVQNYCFKRIPEKIGINTQILKDGIAFKDHLEKTQSKIFSEGSSYKSSDGTEVLYDLPHFYFHKLQIVKIEEELISFFDFLK